MKKKYFSFSLNGEHITALIVSSKSASAKFILHVPEHLDGNIIFRAIKILDRKFRRTRKKKFFLLKNTKRLVISFITVIIVVSNYSISR